MFYDAFTESAAPAVDFSQIPDFKYECNYEGALMSIYEAECNFNNIMKAVGISELKYFKESQGGDLFMEQEDSRKAFIDKILAWFKDKVEAVWAFIKKWALTFKNAFVDSGKFVAKYKPVIEKADIQSFKFKGFKYSGIEKCPKIVLWPFVNDAPMEEDKIRGKVCGLDTDVSAKEFAGKYNEILKGSASAEELDISKSDVLAAFGKLDKSAIAKKVKKVETTAKQVDSMFSAVKKELNKSKDKSEELTAQFKAFKGSANAAHKAIAIYTSALYAESKQAKAIILTALSKVKKAPKAEEEK